MMIKFIFFIVAFMFLVSCQSAPEIQDDLYNVNIIVENNANPYGSNIASPIAIRLYQLSKIQKFNEAEFVNLYNEDTKFLGSDLISRQVLPIYQPDSNHKIRLDVNKNTRFIAVFAEFANFNESKAMASIKLPKSNKSTIDVNVIAATISISVANLN